MGERKSEKLRWEKKEKICVGERNKLRWEKKIGIDVGERKLR